MLALARKLAAITAVALVGGCSGPDADADADAALRRSDQLQTLRDSAMRIRIIAADQTFTAVLGDSETARDFASLLPITLTLSDFNRTEKIADLPRKLSTGDAPEGVDPVAGDLAYYAPWGNFALFYRNFSYSPGLVRLGRVEGDAGGLSDLSPTSVRVEIVT